MILRPSSLSLLGVRFAAALAVPAVSVLALIALDAGAPARAGTAELEARGEDVRIGPGALLPVEGSEREIRVGTGRAVRLGEGWIEVPGAEERTAARLQGWLRRGSSFRPLIRPPEAQKA